MLTNSHADGMTVFRFAQKPFPKRNESVFSQIKFRRNDEEKSEGMESPSAGWSRKGVRREKMKKTVILMTLLCLLLLAQGVFAQASFRDPQPVTGLVYDGSKQNLLIAGSVSGDESANYYYFNKYTNTWSKELKDIPSEQYPKTYKVYWVLYRGEENINTVSNLPGVREETVTIAWLDQPQPRTGLVYDGSKQYLVDPSKPGTAKGNDRYFYRVRPEQRWETELPSRVEEGKYTVEYLLAPLDGMNPPAGATAPSGSFEVTLGNPKPQPQPGPLRPIYDGEDVFNSNKALPGTGFSTRFNKPLAVQPGDLTYHKLDMRIQIPSINVDAELTGVPEFGDSWAVEWLADRAGLLDGSALPGEGFALIAAHNHLNAEDMGPFGLLFSLAENDRIFINTADGGLQIYSVYANKLVEPDDMQKLAEIAENEAGSIILVTCENEMVEGGYMNRRVVFAKPL